MNTIPEFYCGQEHKVAYPFSRATYLALPDEFDGLPVEEETWRPGVMFDQIDIAYADATGYAVYTVIAVFKPGSFPERVFYTRNWIDPDGKRFGKSKLRITTKQNFKVLLRGYRHSFELPEAA